MKRKPPGAFDIRVSALPPVADKVLLPLLSVQLPQKGEDDAANLARIREAVAKAPDDAWGKRALAIAEAAAGDSATAAARLDTLLLETPSDPVLLRWRARLYEPWSRTASAADVSAARKLLVRANRVAPNDWLVLSDYVQTFESRGETLSDPTLDVLAKAYSLAPQQGVLAYRTAMAMAQAGRYDIAEVAMGPLVNNPHSGRAMVLERTLLDALRERDKGAVEAALSGIQMARGAQAAD
jgi:tetratricopeptide (TPR) repeat protein